ncbi:family A G protein-coupled receptor-like protein [Conidiobolus coronatus NRRL 28638]|uniref:Family A G protein-coupled receptor-like protein n=1 Tax=Conidiobolus coronatus (strain ATCC 28846 / CBS 209.66 / NRRL 28638) TaxID=796925 RepID=A0A137P0S4_CONC2|nr:family A G protein-coupled receptor-like protein [Conidiobolus coronatus NRRL 28638]|eukprot:KXN68449.1 family A G protein-coupled receptor-like protein [Conidiobolus coronatus NRRL 28638]
MTEQVYSLSNPLITVITESVMFSISLTGLLFNGLVIYIMLFRHKSKEIDIWFMTYIAIFDILLAITIIGSQISKMVTFHEILFNNIWYCQYSGMFNILLTSTSIDGVGMLSLIRALAIVKNITFKSVYWYILMILLFIANLIFGIFGVTNQAFRVMESQSYCQPSFSKNRYSKIYSIVIIGKMFLMLFILMVSYICISVKYCNLLSDMNNSKDSSSDLLVGRKPLHVLQRAVITKLFGLVFMYMLCFLPELITLVYNISTKSERNPIADAISGSAMNFTIVVNSVFVLFYHEETRRILVNLLPLWMHRGKLNGDAYSLEGR